MSYTLKLSILNELIKMGKLNSVFGFDGNFTQEQLDSITSLQLTDCDSIDGISLLRNLQTLKIISSKLESFGSIGPINKIANFSEINKLINLKRLYIANDYNIRFLDISNLSNLETLKIFNAPNLSWIKGLSQLNLNEVVICDCSLSSIGNAKDYIINTSLAANNIIDINLASSLLQDKKLLTKKYDAGLTNIRFGEHVYANDEIYTINVYQMLEMHKIAMDIIRRLKLEDLSDLEKAFRIYVYAIGTLKYDTEGLNYRNNNDLDNISKDKREYFSRRMMIINSAFGAFTQRKVVCDGYVNMIKYLLSLCGISSKTVICQKENGQLHSALKIQIDGKWCYCDPEQDSYKKVRYFNLSKDEMEKLYTLSMKEQFDNGEMKEGTYGQYYKRLHR